MRIAVAGSGEYVDFLIRLLSDSRHKVTVIDQDKEFCERICAAYDVDATLGNPCREEILREAGIRNFDVIVALGPEDTDNFEICQMGKKAFGIHRSVCAVKNPRNVEVFEQLGIDRVMNVPRLIAEMIG